MEFEKKSVRFTTIVNYDYDDNEVIKTTRLINIIHNIDVGIYEESK